MCTKVRIPLLRKPRYKYRRSVDVAGGIVNADLILQHEWIDDRFRFRNHPNESLAQLDNTDLSDFRFFSPRKIWTPEISLSNRLRDSVYEVIMRYLGIQMTTCF